MSLDLKTREWLEEVFETYYDKVYSFLYSRTGNTAVAEDLASQTFVKIAENYKTYRSDKGAVSTWVFTIALNEMRDNIRRRKQNETVVLDDLPELTDGEDIETEVLKKEAEKELLLILSQLNEQQRNTITLKYYGGLTNREIACVSGISESNVSTILNRAIKKMKILVEKCDKNAVCAYKNKEELK